MVEYSESLRPAIHVIINILFVLGEGSALLRLWTKAAVVQSFGWDDWAMTMVAIVNCGQHAILYLFMSAGAGLHQDEVLQNDPTALSRMLKYLFAEEIWYLFLHFWIKMSFLMFFKRLSPSRNFQLAVHCVIGANIFVTVGTWVLYCLQCIPIEAYWAPEKHPDVKCLSFGLSLWLPASALIAVDWAIFFLPLSTVLSLQMSLKRRLQVLAVVTTGGSSVVVSCLRLIVIHKFTVTEDIIWEIGHICTVSAAEMEVAIMAANMPGISALWKAWRGGTLSGQSGRSTHPHSGKDGVGGPTSGSNGTHALVTFSQKRSRPHAPLNDDELLLTRHEEEANHRFKSDRSSVADLSSSRKTNSDEELGVKARAAAKPGDIVVNYDVVITEEHEENPGEGRREPFPWDSQSQGRR